MKKLFTLLALICLMVTGAWANVTSIDQVEENAIYTLTCSRGSLTVSSDKSKLASSTDAGTTFSPLSADYQFQFKKSGDNYYLYSVGAAKYSKNDGTLVDNIGDAAALTLNGWGNGTAQPRWDDNHCLNFGGQSQLVISNWKTGDAGNYFTIALLPITSIDDIVETRAYTLTSVDRGSFVYSSTYADGYISGTNRANYTFNANDENCQFVFLKNDGKTYLYSLGADKFVVYGSDGLLTSATAPTQGIALLPSTGDSHKDAHPTVLRIDDNHQCNMSTNQGKGILTNCNNTGDNGNRLCIRPVAELTSEQLAAIKEAFNVTYTVNVEGAPSAVTVTVKGVTVENNTVSLSSTATEADVVAEVVPGYFPATVTVGSDYTINVSYRKWPFETADSFANIQKWYGMNLHYDRTHAPYYDATATPNIQTDGEGYKTEDKYAWGFVMNNDGTVKVYNKAAGSGFSLYSADNNTVCALSDTNSSDFKVRLTGWTAAAQASGGFCLNVEGQQYVNHQDALLKHWRDADAGSTFNVFELDFGTKTYTVHITGAPEGTKVLYGEQPYTDGQTISSVEVIAAEITPDTVDGYAYELSVDGTDIYVNYLAVPVAGDYIRLQNCNDNKYLTANGAKMNDIENGDNASLKSLWYVKDNGSGALQLMSVATGGFIGNITQSATVSLNTGNTTTFVFEAYNNHIVFKPTGGGDYQYGHVNGGDLVGWTKTGVATQWVLTKVEAPATTDYTITVTGLPEGVTGGLLYYGQMHTSTLNAPTGLDASLLSGASVSGYKAPTVSMEGTAITVTYAPLPFVVGETYTIKGVFADKDAEWYICDSGTTAVAAAELPADKSGNWIYTGDGKFQNVKNNTRYLATGSGLTTNTTGVAFTVQDGLAEGTKTLFNGSTSYAVGKAGGISGGQYGKGEKHNTGDWTTDFFIEILSVTVPNTLTPADGAEVNSLSTVSVEFTGDNVSEGIIPFPGGQLEGTTQILPTLKNGETTVTATSVAVRDGVYNIFDITFPTGQITSGEWKLDIPQGTFYVAVPDALGEYDPVARIKANYTVSLIPTAGRVYTIKAHFKNTTYKDLYLSSDTSAEQLLVPMDTTVTASQSYWVAEDSGDTVRPWKFKSGYGYAKYLDWQNGGLTANGDNFNVTACETEAGTYHLNVSTNDRHIGTWGNNNDTKKGFGAVGSGGCWSQNHAHNNGANSNWTTDYIIEEVKNVDVYTVSGTGSVGVTNIPGGYTYASAVAAGGVLIVPAGTTLTDANFTDNDNVFVTIDNEAKTIILTEIIVTKPTSLDQIEQGVPYTITTYDRGAMIYTENGLSSTTKESVDVDPTDADQQFLFVEHHGQYYFYSVGGEKFINVTGKNENNNRAVGVDAPVNTSLTFEASTGSHKEDFPVVLNIDGHHVGISNSFVPAVITHYNGTGDGGNMLRLTPVLGTTVDLEPIIAKLPKICPLDAATYYVTIENHETGHQPFLFNDIQYADEITLQGTTVNTNGYIWKVTSDGEGNITDIVNAENGKGINPSGGKATSSITEFQYTAGTNDGYYNLINSTAITGGHDRLNASNGSPYVNQAGLRAVTTWNGAHNDNEWKFNAVDTEGLEEYNVVITQPDGCRGYVLYDGKKAGNGGFFLAPAGSEQSAFSAPELRGYLCDGVTLTDHTITVTYTAAEAVQVNYTLYLKEGETETLLETAAEAVTEYVGQAPQHPFTIPGYVDVTYDQGVTDGLIDGTATDIKVITDYNANMPFVPGQMTTVDIDVRNHYYFHVEEVDLTIDNVDQTVWVPRISPKESTFGDDAAYIWIVEGDWYNGFRFHNDQLSSETNCYIAFKHHGVEKTEEQAHYNLVSSNTYDGVWSRATLSDGTDASSLFELVYAPEKGAAKYQFRIRGTGMYMNFRDEAAYPGQNPDSLLCLYSGGYGDQASSFTFHDGEVCTEADKLAVQAMIDAIEKGGVGALADKNSQEYLDLQELLDRINDTSKGCTRALFNTYTNKLVNSQQERIAPRPGEAYRLAVRTKSGHNLYLKDGGGYTTDSLQAAVYVLAQKDEDTYFLAGNNNEELTYFMNQGGTAGSYDAESCDLSYELMNGIEADGETINATPAAMYATLCLTDANGNVATMNVADESNPTWASDVEMPFMNDDYSSAIVMEPVKYTYNKPKLASGTGDGHEGVWSTIWLPFPMVFPDGVEVYKGTQERTVKDEPYLGLERVDTDHVVPQGGYVLYSESLSEGEIKVAPKAAAVAEVRTEEDAAFVGFTEGNPTELYNTYLKDQNPYVLANKSKGIGFYKYTATTAPMGKAIWLKPVAGSDAECVKLGFDDIISAIEALHGHTGNAEIYDLQGHRLDKVQKGQINVINGQKIMFK